MTKSEYAFRASAERLFELEPELYFWTFTFVKVWPDWYYSNIWSQFIRDLGYLYGGTLRGLKVTELHKDHGIHYHALLNKRIWVGEVRRLGKRYGIGRVHVKRANEGSVPYLAKYLTKQYKGQHVLHAGINRWATVGSFRGTKVKNVEIDSPFHRRMKRINEACGGKASFRIASYVMSHWHDEERMDALEKECRRRAFYKWASHRKTLTDGDGRKPLPLDAEELAALTASYEPAEEVRRKTWLDYTCKDD